MKNLYFCLLIGFLFSCKQTPKETSDSSEVTDSISYPTAGAIEQQNERLALVLNPNAKIEVLAKGFNWTEGPLWLESEQTLIWSDVPENKIYQWKEGEESSLYLQSSGFTGADPSGLREPGSNGLLLNADGKLVLSQCGNRQMAYMNAPLSAPEPAFVTIANTYNAKKFNSPNDAVYDNVGNLFFTDPPYGLEGIDDSPLKEQPFNGVYKVDKEWNVSVMDSTLTKPNGIAFSPDFKKCYVANSDPEKAIWMVYDINENKDFTNGRVFFDATSLVEGRKGLPDGMKVADDGTLFASGPGGILVFSPEGEHLGTINTGQATSNCAFNKDKSVLFMTADDYVMRLSLK